MKLKSSIFEKSSITKTESYITDQFVLFTTLYPKVIDCTNINEGKNKLTDLGDHVIKEKIIKDKNNLRDITALFMQSQAIYNKDFYQKIEVKDCSLKIQLKFYDLIISLLKDDDRNKLYVDNNNTCLYLFHAGAFFGAIMVLKN